MKKIIIFLLMVALLAGCSLGNGILGTWETTAVTPLNDKGTLYTFNSGGMASIQRPVGPAEMGTYSLTAGGSLTMDVNGIMLSTQCIILADTMTWNGGGVQETLIRK